jgi:S-adenosylmethionine synthetase
MSEYISENMSGRMPENMSDKISENISDRMPEDMPNRMSDKMSDRMSENLSITKYINVMMGISRNKIINYINNIKIIYLINYN